MDTSRPVVEVSVSGSRGGIVQALRQSQLYKKPIVFIPTLMWVFGMYAAFLSPAPRPISEEMQAKFDRKLEEAQHLTQAKYAAEDVWLQAQLRVEEAQTWFWWFNKEKYAEVRGRQAVEKEARKEMERLQSQQEHLWSDAKRELGIWSEAGLQESRVLFWRSFQAGKVFGRRQTFWDTIINELYTSSADRSLLGTVLQVVFSAVINFTVGMFVCLFVYAWQLPALLATYQASLPSALLFFAVALIAAASVVVGFLVCLYSAGATAAYASVAVTASLQQRRLTAARREMGLLREHAE